MKTPISYYGGKQRLAKRIIQMIPDHKQYVEPFFGGGAVFFAKNPSPHEVINDMDNRVINFYDVLQNNFVELQQKIKGSLHSETLYKLSKYILQTGATLEYKLWTVADRVSQAWAFYINTNMGFGHKLNAGFAFGNTDLSCKASMHRRKSFDELFHERVEKIEIFNRDALNLIKLKDGKDTFFYLDPPYFNSECGHYAGYSEKDFIQLLDLICTIEGKFLLSSYCSNVLIRYAECEGWKVEHHSMALTVNNVNTEIGEQPKKIEVLTRNY